MVWRGPVSPQTMDSRTIHEIMRDLLNFTAETEKSMKLQVFFAFYAIWGVQDPSKPFIILKEYWCFQPGAASALQKRKNVDFNVILQKSLILSIF